MIDLSQQFIENNFDDDTIDELTNIFDLDNITFIDGKCNDVEKLLTYICEQDKIVGCSLCPLRTSMTCNINSNYLNTLILIGT